jgi:hypothetical protein
MANTISVSAGTSDTTRDGGACADTKGTESTKDTKGTKDTKDTKDRKAFVLMNVVPITR